jgi:hypothetical protein
LFFEKKNLKIVNVKYKLYFVTPVPVNLLGGGGIFWIALSPKI